MLDMLILAESELFVGISISTYSWYLREIRCLEVGSHGAPAAVHMRCIWFRVGCRCNSSMCWPLPC